MNISISEVMLVLLIALLVIKPEQIPEVALCLGRTARVLRRIYTQITHQINKFIDHPESSAHEKK